LNTVSTAPTSPRARPVLVGLLAAVGTVLAGNAIGGILVDIIRHSSIGGRLGSVVWLLVASVPGLGARYLWLRASRRRRDAWIAAFVGALALAGVYAVSLAVNRARMGDFYGVLTPKPSDSFVDSTPNRPRVLIRINSHGFRMPDWAVDKRPGTFRVAMLGGSMLAGFGVEEDQTLPIQLERLLRARVRDPSVVEVLNLGLGGANLPTDVEMAGLAERRLRADATILCVEFPRVLSRFDVSDERRDATRLSAFSAASLLLGSRAAIHLWSIELLTGTLDEGSMAFLGTELDRTADLRGAQAAPLIFFTFTEPPTVVADTLKRRRDVQLVGGPPRREEFFVPNDGHPTALGDQTFASQLADVVAALPAFRDAALR
jgi:hypothetical protein